MTSKKQINLGQVKIGQGAPISVQTMTNTDTCDIDATLFQINEAYSVGCDIIRVSCPMKESTIALKDILRSSPIPIIADIHFNYKRAIESIDAGAVCVRINPGNTPESGIREIVSAARANEASIRIGINSGSLSKDLLDKYGEPTVDAIVESAVINARHLEDLNFENFKISVKSSNVKDMIDAYRKLSKLVDYPLHLGVTEAGPYFPGLIKSAIGIGSLLADNIGDTLRVSLSTKDIKDEVKAGRQILKSLGLLKDSVNIVSCPTCARTLIDVVGISHEIEEYCERLQKQLKISVLGCVVNGIGEAMDADIGIHGFQEGVAKLYLKGKEIKTVADKDIITEMKALIDKVSSNNKY